MWSRGCDQLGSAGAEGVRDPEGARHRRRLPSRARVGRDRVQDRGGLQGHQPRLRHPHALQWGEHDYGRAYDDAEKARYAVHGDACDLRSITGRRGRSPFGLATEPEVEFRHGQPATISTHAAPAASQWSPAIRLTRSTGPRLALLAPASESVRQQLGRRHCKLEDHTLTEAIS